MALPWWVFSWYHFGSAIPTTLVIKTLQKSFGDATFANGLQKMWQAGTTLPLSLALVPAAVGLLTVLDMLAAASVAGCLRSTGRWRRSVSAASRTTARTAYSGCRPTTGITYRRRSRSG